MKRQSEFAWRQETKDAVYIVDLDNGGLSVTNDAENVVKACLDLYGPKKIVYRDSEGNWDELRHDGKQFTIFARWTGWIPK